MWRILRRPHWPVGPDGLTDEWLFALRYYTLLFVYLAPCFSTAITTAARRGRRMSRVKRLPPDNPSIGTGTSSPRAWIPSNGRPLLSGRSNWDQNSVTGARNSSKQTAVFFVFIYTCVKSMSDTGLMRANLIYMTCFNNIF